MRRLVYLVTLIFVFSLFNISILSQNVYSDPVPLDTAVFTNVTFSAGFQGVGGQFLAWGDYDNDGDLDLLINGARLFKNNGAPSWDFTEVTSQAGISGGSYGTWADWNNDGYLDFFCAGSDKLYKNNGPPDWDFADVTASSNILKESHSTGSGWGDYDNDGDVDLFKIRGEDWNDGDPIYFPNSFWRNEGDGTFTNVTVSAGVDESASPKYSRGVAWADYNDDGLLDIYISNYRQLVNYLYENNGDGTFTDVAPQKGVADGPPLGEGGNLDPYDRPGHGVGSVWGDYDNDGYLDLWVTNLNHKDARTSDDSLLYHNDGPPDYSFTNMRDDSQIPVKPYVFPNDGDELFVGCAWGDYDNDGDLDLYLPQIYDIDYAYSFLYENNGDGTFTDVTVEGGVRVWDTYAGCWADYDNDGDLDLITSGRDSGGNADPHFIHLFRNDGPQGNWLHIILKGDGVYSNRAAIGARVTITTDTGDVQVKEVEGGTGPHGHQNSLTLEFGFGLYTGTVDIEIRWPQNKVQFLKNISLNQKLTINDQSAGDLSILGMWYDKQSPIMGETVLLSSTVKNVGSTLINTADVKFYLDAISPSNQILPTQTVSNMMPNDERQVSIDWDTAGVSDSHVLYVKAEIVDPPPVTTSNIMTKMIYIRAQNALPIAKLVANRTTLYAGESVFFDASNSTDDTRISDYLFDYGNGAKSGWITQSSISYVYPGGGDFIANVSVRDEDSGESLNSADIPMEVNAKPHAYFIASSSDIFKGENITFDGSGSYDQDGVIEEYYFDFGDGFSTGWTTDSLVKHTYSFVGNYTVSLYVKDDENDISEHAWHTEIGVWARPIASLSATPQVIYKNMVVSFDASQSEDEDGTVDEYFFDFGDGENSDWITSPFIAHTYTFAGIFSATLIVRDNDMYESENQAEITIEVRAYPVAFLISDQTMVYKMESVEFDGSQSTDEGGNVVEYNFDFGDGETSGWIASPVVEHVYEAAGTYNATLLVRDNHMDVSQDISQVTIEVKAMPQAVMEASSTGIYKGDSITFNASESIDEGGTIEAYYFDFGDGENATWNASSSITHQYNDVGEYTAFVRVRDNDGDESLNTASITITVSAKPNAHLVLNSSIIHEGESVILNATQSNDEDGEIVEYFFDYGDGQFSGWTSNSVMQHLYPKHGIYNLTLIVKDDEEDESEIPDLQILEVRAIPKAVLQVDNTTVDEGEDVTFFASNSKDKDGEISRYFFDFGNGKDSGWIAQDTVSHSYSNAGSYIVFLWVKDNHEDVSTNKASLKITVEVPNKIPTAQIDEITPSPVTFGREVTFKGQGNDEDGRIIAYLWSSNIDGEIGFDEIFSINSLSVGEHTISFQVQDNEDDWSEEVSGNLVVKAQNDVPVLRITYPEDNIRVEGTLTITGSVEDPDGSITELEISIDGGAWNEIEISDLWSHTINTSNLASGEHVITIRAYDGEDYSEDEFLTILVGEKEEETDIMIIYGIILLVIFAVIVLAYIIGKGVKKKSPTEMTVIKQPRTFRPIEVKQEDSKTKIEG
jgi:hypothetical protein